MGLRRIVKEGYESLSKVCRPVEKFDKKLEILADDLTDTLIDANGAGLAAPQVGVVRRIVAVLDDDDETVLILVNPEIIKTEGTQEYIEGCLSIPGVWGKTLRPAKVTVRAQDIKGNFFELTREGRTAVCFCHEIDHLNGILFREHVTEYIDESELEAE